MLRFGYQGSKVAILVAGGLLALYLLSLLTLGYFGQSRLRVALHEQEARTVEKQAAAIGYRLNDLQNTVDRMGQSRQIQAFLANRDLGMSMEYGLGVSLKAIGREFDRLIARPGAHQRAVFSHIALVCRDSRVLIEKPGAAGSAPLWTRQGQSGQQLRIAAAVIYKGAERGHIEAQVDARTVFQPLLINPTGTQGNQRTALVGPDDEILVSSNHVDWPHWRRDLQQAGDAAFLLPIPDSELRIVAFFNPASMQRMITSRWFLGAFALLLIPLLGGFAHLLRLNSHNLVLRTRVQATTEQRALLGVQNERLQREIDRRLESEEKLAHQANYDQLTGLPNRNLALDRLAQSIKRTRREGGSTLILFLDLDRFKQVNDSLGHAAGDELLREAAQRLKAHMRDSDTVSRLGGDEFLVICPEMHQRNDWEHCAQSLLKALSVPFYVGEHEFFIGASIGVAAYPEGGDEPLKLLKNADIAMYAAKDAGRNRYCLYDPWMDQAALRGMRLENNLRHALHRHEFSLAFQPIVELRSGTTVAVEALLRWSNEELGNVSPERFIPVAEETGLIHEIGEWVMIEACRTIGAMQTNLQFRVAINLSPKQFSRPARLLQSVLQALREHELMPEQIELEITESVLIDDRPEIAKLIGQLDRIGVRLSIDDFGTGYSALNYLQRFPFDTLKIDRAFTSQVPDSEANASLIRAIVAMAHALGLEVIAEGIETREQTDFLLPLDCEFGQGYLYARPMTADALRLYLAAEGAVAES